jgi:hypothetical protein
MAIRSDGDRDGPEAESTGFKIGVPTGIRTPVTSVKGMCPRPLDDGDLDLDHQSNWWSQAGSNRRPLACHASALPAELWPHCIKLQRFATQVHEI